MALVSDAGMPTVSDPGQRLVRACRMAGLPVDVIPGPCAVSTALAGSGIPWERYIFGGFLPNRSGGRQNALAAALAVEGRCAHVFYESPYRILKTLAVLEELAPERELCLCRELTKQFQEYLRGFPSEVMKSFDGRKPKGEITLIIGPADYPSEPRRCGQRIREVHYKTLCRWRHDHRDGRSVWLRESLGSDRLAIPARQDALLQRAVQLVS